VGSETAIEVCQPLGRAAAADDEQHWLCERSREALAAFTEGDFGKAQILWKSIQARHPADGPARYYVERCAKMKAGVPPDWDGTIRQTDK